ncbi:MAG: PKD domain-containing protein [Planctomycetota bacterium]
MRRKLIAAIMTVAVLGVSQTAPALEPPQLRLSVSRFGITWTFDQPRMTGQFVNGDWWVVGPTQVVSVSPGPYQAHPDGVGEIERYTYIADFVNQFGDTAFQNDPQMRNGSMVNPTWRGDQGYDSGGRNYNSALSVSFPYTLDTNQSLISTISHTALQNPLLIPFYSDKNDSLLRTAAILTCLGSVPPEDAFRPPYAGSSKPIYQAGDIQWDRLPSLAPVGSTPTLTQMNRWVRRPWLDHVSSWMLGVTSPSENMAHYGREYARGVSMVGLRLMLDDPIDDKRECLVNFIQLGIDLQGLRAIGARWQMGGGITSGRKWPILFAGILLDDPAMSTFPGASAFHEDQQTYWGDGWNGQTVLWQMVVHHGTAPTYEERHPSTWDSMDMRSHGYRGCCNGLAWIGEGLGALLLGAKENWNHDQFFDYCDRWMTESPQPYRDAGVSAHTNFYRHAFDDFVDHMYDTYRDQVPAQPGGTNNMKWVSSRWIPDANPHAVHADAGPDRTVPDTDLNGFEIVTLDGSASTTSSGTIVGYVWTMGTSLLGTSAVQATLLPVGVHTITLEVSNSEGHKGVDTAVITVEAPELFADAGPDQALTDADGDGVEFVTLDGSASHHTDGTITDYLWTLAGTYLGSNAVVMTALPIGEHTATLKVTGSDGAQATDTVAITVVEATRTPGDADEDGDVDLDDFAALKQHFGTTTGATWAMGDFDGDGDVDLDDFAALKLNFGQ